MLRNDLQWLFHHAPICKCPACKWSVNHAVKHDDGNHVRTANAAFSRLVAVRTLLFVSPQRVGSSGTGWPPASLLNNDTRNVFKLLRKPPSSVRDFTSLCLNGQDEPLRARWECAVLYLLSRVFGVWDRVSSTIFFSFYSLPINNPSLLCKMEFHTHFAHLLIPEFPWRRVPCVFCHCSDGGSRVAAAGVTHTHVPPPSFWPWDSWQFNFITLSINQQNIIIQQNHPDLKARWSPPCSPWAVT